MEIIRKPGSATSQSDITAPCNIGIKTFYIIKKHKKKSYL